MAAEIVVIAQVAAQPGKEQELERALADMAEPTHAEDGCAFYALHRDREESTRFTLIEGWTSQDALDQHLQRPFVAKALEVLPTLIVGEIDLKTYSPLGLGDVKGTLAAAAA